MIHSMLLLIFLLLLVSVGKLDMESCLDCLKKNNPIDSCATYPDIDTFCGPYRISSAFFDDCRLGVSDQDFKSCATDEACARMCVKSFQKDNAALCLDRRKNIEGLNYSTLSCADYGRLHFGGLSACGKEDNDAIQLYLSNLTSLCGCLTVFGECTSVPLTTTTSAGMSSDGLLLLYIIPPICGVVVIVAVVLCVFYLRNNHIQKMRRKRQAIAEQESENIVEKRIERNELALGDNRTSIVNNYVLKRNASDGDLEQGPLPQANLDSATLPDTNMAVLPPPRVNLNSTATSVTMMAAAFETPTEGSFDVQYEQPISYEYTADDDDSDSASERASHQHKMSEAQQPPSSEISKFEDMYINSRSIQRCEHQNVITPINKPPKPTPRQCSEGGTMVITYINGPTFVEQADL